MEIGKIIEMNYGAASRYFRNANPQDRIPYISTLPTTKLTNLWDDPHACERIISLVKPKSLIFVDGASVNGKSTLARWLAQNSNATVLDIDIICLNWIIERMHTGSLAERAYLMQNYDKATDDFIFDNLEDIVKKESKSEKAVILVGTFLSVISRAIVARTLGKYFEHVISLLCCEKSFKHVIKMFKCREKELGKDKRGLSNIREEYELARKLIEENNGIFLGFGMDESYLFNASTLPK